MKFSIVTEAPAWAALLCVLAGIVYAGLMYFREERLKETTKFLRGLLAGLRFIVVTLLAFLLLTPLLKMTSREVEKPVIVIAQDASQSLTLGKDSVFLRSDYPKKMQALIDALSDKYEVKTYSFGDHFRDSLDFSFKDKLTDFSSLFDEIETRYSDRNLGAVIVASDGIFNQGQSPVYAAERIKAPVFTIALGDTTVKKDLVLTNVIHNRIAFLGNTFPLDVVIDAQRCPGEKSTLTVSKNGNVLASQPVDLSTDPFNKTISFSIKADVPGLQRYTVALTPLDGECNLLNNKQDIFIDVLDSREKILIVSAFPHPDVAALKDAIETNDNYEVKVTTLQDFTDPVSKYNLVILHSLPSDAMPAQKLMNDIAAANVPVLYITGAQQSYNAFNNLHTGISIRTSGARANECEAVFSKDFPLFTLSDDATKYFPQLPALSCPFGNFETTPAVTTLFRQKIGMLSTDYPLWVFSQQGDRKVGVIVGEGIWKWRLHDFADHNNHDIFNELIYKTIQFLSVREDKSFFRITAKTDYLENESVIMEAEVYNESYQLINTPDVNIDIINAAGKRFPFVFSKTANAYRLDAKQFPVGQYTFEAKTKVGDKVYTQNGKFSVSPLLVEIATSTANHQVLYNLSKQHNGEMLYPSALDNLVQKLNSRDDIKPVIYNPKKLVDIINLWWIFALLMTLLTLEWALRKRYGAY